MPRYVGNLQRARQALDYGLTWRDEVPVADFWASLNWPLLMVGAMSLLLAAWAASLAYRHDPAPPPAVAGAPSGFGGWLFLLALVVGVWPLRLLKTILETLPAYATPRWTLLTSPGSEAYHPGWAPLLLAALVVNLGLLVFSVLTLWLFFKRRSSAPRVLIATMWTSFVLLVADQLATPLMLPDHAPEWGSMLKLGLGSALWTGYLLRSRRVRATFVRRLHRPEPERPAALAETAAPAAPA